MEEKKKELVNESCEKRLQVTLEEYMCADIWDRIMQSEYWISIVGTIKRDANSVFKVI